MIITSLIISYISAVSLHKTATMSTDCDSAPATLIETSANNIRFLVPHNSDAVWLYTGQRLEIPTDKSVTSISISHDKHRLSNKFLFFVEDENTILGTELHGTQSIVENGNDDCVWSFETDTPGGTYPFKVFTSNRKNLGKKVICEDANCSFGKIGKLISDGQYLLFHAKERQQIYKLDLAGDDTILTASDFLLSVDNLPIDFVDYDAHNGDIISLSHGKICLIPSETNYPQCTDKVPLNPHLIRFGLDGKLMIYHANSISIMDKTDLSIVQEIDMSSRFPGIGQIFNLLVDWKRKLYYVSSKSLYKFGIITPTFNPEEFQISRDMPNKSSRGYLMSLT